MDGVKGATVDYMHGIRPGCGRRRIPRISGKSGLPGQPGHGRGSCRWKCRDRKSTRLNSSHVRISYAVFCLKKKKKKHKRKNEKKTQKEGKKKNKNARR